MQLWPYSYHDSPKFIWAWLTMLLFQIIIYVGSQLVSTYPISALRLHLTKSCWTHTIIGSISLSLYLFVRLSQKYYNRWYLTTTAGHSIENKTIRVDARKTFARGYKKKILKIFCSCVINDSITSDYLQSI